MKPLSIDINCDLGETLPKGIVVEYEHLLPWISSANVACGGHCGDTDSMRRAVELCLTHGVAIGAHPSYADKENFGRVSMVVSQSELTEELRHQVGTLAEICAELGTGLSHVKPHGALYGDSDSESVSMAITTVCCDQDLPVLSMWKPVLSRACTRFGVDLIIEEFADRAYQSGTSLRPRQQEGAVIENEQQLRIHLDYLLDGKVLTDNDGVLIRDFHSLCVHGDNPGALHALQLIHQMCEEHDIAID